MGASPNSTQKRGGERKGGSDFLSPYTIFRKKVGGKKKKKKKRRTLSFTLLRVGRWGKKKAGLNPNGGKGGGKGKRKIHHLSPEKKKKKEEKRQTYSFFEE